MGVKSLFRFAYDRCNNGPIGENNYTAQTILGHIQQVKQRFQAEIDVVYVLQAGFLGCWGEYILCTKLLRNSFSVCVSLCFMY